MADPFSIFSGALGVADICIRLAGYLKSVNKTAKYIDKDIEALENEVNTFVRIYRTLSDLCDTGIAQQRSAQSKPPGLDDPGRALWERAAELVKEGEHLVQKLRDHLLNILGDEHTPRFQKLDDIRRAVKLLAKDKEYSALRGRFTGLNLELNMMMTAIELSSNALFRSDTYTSLEQLPGKISQKLQELGLQLKAQIAKLEREDKQFEPSILSAKAAINYASLNEHYYVQKPDTSIWTGRDRYLEELRDAILDPRLATNRIQRRFVVHGISGAGKTQFCCKFAQDYRESFWAIFWIDASSPQNATESWKKIAKIGGKDPNAEAGKYWLSNLNSPWLLIIDSADGSEDLIGSQFPTGERGYILITTRNPRLCISATVGHLSLDKLDESEASDLLRKASHHEPWDMKAMSSASSIAEHLGYLPLALIHAGKAIYHKLCSLHSYIPFFNETLDNVRIRRPSLFLSEEEDAGMGAFTSFDIIYSGLEAQAYRSQTGSVKAQDAIELLNMFAFLHSNNITVDTILRAGRNLLKAAQQQRSGGPPATSSTKGTSTLLERMKTKVTILILRFANAPPTLPRLLTSKETKSQESRMRYAIDLLVRMSLISESSEPGSYSMHPLVHMWVRRRLSTAEQALWCDATANTLAASIKIPPLADEEGDSDYYIRVLQHVEHVRDVRESIRAQLQQNRCQASGIRSWITMNRTPAFSVSDAFNCARYSRVYMECAKYAEAEVLQRRVRDFIVSRLGSEHPICVPIQAALAGALWHLGRPAESQEMQEGSLRICRLKLGEDDPLTLKVMDGLGETYWQRGWLKESKALHECAIEGMSKKPDMKREELKAINHLGRVCDWYTHFEQARDLHQRASTGLTELFGSDDIDATVATDHLAMTLLIIGGYDNTQRAYDLMQDVYGARLRRLGEEHVYTLWAACNLARTLAARGDLENRPDLIADAKKIYNDGLAIAERNLGPTHFGTLMGRVFLAQAYVHEKQYDIAEREYKDIAEIQKTCPGARAGTHRDRLQTFQRLIECYEAQDRFEDAIDVCRTIIQELDGLGGQKHPWRQQIVDIRDRLRLRAGLPETPQMTQLKARDSPPLSLRTKQKGATF